MSHGRPLTTEETEERLEKARQTTRLKMLATGYDVWRWPEFQTLLKRLDIEIDKRILGLSIRVYHDEYVTVNVECIAQVKQAEKTQTEDENKET